MGKNQKKNIKIKVDCAKQNIQELINDKKYELNNNVIFMLAHIDRLLDGIMEEIKYESN
jgi:Mor family transcriptional regulator